MNEQSRQPLDNPAARSLREGVIVGLANHTLLLSRDGTASADEKGRFRISGLSPSERYLAVAVDYLDDGEHYDPEFLERMRGTAIEFSLDEMESRAVELTVMER